MKSGFIGLPGVGKTTLFEALTQHSGSQGQKGQHRIATIQVPDPRVDHLSHTYQPKKTTYAQVEYLLPGISSQEWSKKNQQTMWTAVRDCDALIHVLRNFSGYGLDSPTPVKDFIAVNQELILTDLVVVENRLDRLTLDRKRGKPGDPEEFRLLEECQKSLEQELPLRRDKELAESRLLRGYAFLSAKPMLVLFNNDDDQEDLPTLEGELVRENCMAVRGKLEQELAQMDEEDAAEFLSEFNIKASAMDRVIRQSYEFLGLISFFTVSSDEVKAWTIPRGTPALDAAEAVHTDIKKGFIRAEVLSYQDFADAGSYGEAKKRGTAGLEGKTYPVRDGDIVHFRFNV